MNRIVIFASGSGTNAEQIIKHFYYHENIKIVSVMSNNKDAFVLERAKKYGVPTTVFSRDDLYKNQEVYHQLQELQTDFIVLAGFLWLIPAELVKHFQNKIINIHPALLPKYGGKGMFGDNVHKAVIHAQETESGITIHYVNEKYDDGDIIHQEKCVVTSQDTPETLAEKIHALEHQAFPVVIESIVTKL